MRTHSPANLSRSDFNKVNLRLSFEAKKWTKHAWYQIHDNHWGKLKGHKWSPSFSFRISNSIKLVETNFSEMFFIFKLFLIFEYFLKIEAIDHQLIFFKKQLVSSK